MRVSHLLPLFAVLALTACPVDDYLPDSSPDLHLDAGSSAGGATSVSIVGLAANQAVIAPAQIPVAVNAQDRNGKILTTGFSLRWSASPTTIIQVTPSADTAVIAVGAVTETVSASVAVVLSQPEGATLTAAVSFQVLPGDSATSIRILNAPSTMTLNQSQPISVSTFDMNGNVVDSTPAVSWDGAGTGVLTVTGSPGAYVVTAVGTGMTTLVAHSGGLTSQGALIAVMEEPPSTLSYETNPLNCTLNVQIQNDVPTTTGGTPSSFSVFPSLPTGLLLDKSTGVISGTPMELSAQTKYNVTATNSGGSTSIDLFVSVVQ